MERVSKLFLVISIVVFISLVCLFRKGRRAISKGDKQTSRKVALALTALGMAVDLLIALFPGGLAGLIIINFGNITIVDRENDSKTPGIQAEPPALTAVYEIVEHFPVGWSDDVGGRTAYTLDEVNHGAIDGKIIFNSIIDSKIGHEFNFVGARKNTGENKGAGNLWNGNAIVAEKNCTYLVRLYVHNNGRFTGEDIAEDVSIRFKITDTLNVTGNDVALDGFDSSTGYYGAAVYGYISVPNEEPSMYSDGVKFVSDRPFHLEYIPGTALFQNTGIGKKPGYRLDDNIIWNFIPIGYSEMDGRIPADYPYDSYSCITVTPVFDD